MSTKLNSELSVCCRIQKRILVVGLKRKVKGQGIPKCRRNKKCTTEEATEKRESTSGEEVTTPSKKRKATTKENIYEADEMSKGTIHSPSQSMGTLHLVPISVCQTFPWLPEFFCLVTLTLEFDLILKNFWHNF